MSYIKNIINYKMAGKVIVIALIISCASAWEYANRGNNWEEQCKVG